MAVLTYDLLQPKINTNSQFFLVHCFFKMMESSISHHDHGKMQLVIVKYCETLG